MEIQKDKQISLFLFVKLNNILIENILNFALVIYIINYAESGCSF